MTLLFDANLSPSLVSRSGHVIVSKDRDFQERSFVEGAPPRVVWLDVGNAGTAQIADLLTKERGRILRFGETPDASLLILSIGRSAV